ncbi:MAG: hypothetical protein Q7J31_15155, partial [Syntrophales bacterium]|nr:hypothetical protein [Syntrophales bacterium]
TCTPLNDVVRNRNSCFSHPWREGCNYFLPYFSPTCWGRQEGVKGRWKITFRNTATYHPHPRIGYGAGSNPPPSRGRRYWTFYETVNFRHFKLFT